MSLLQIPDRMMCSSARSVSETIGLIKTPAQFFTGSMPPRMVKARSPLAKVRRCTVISIMLK